MTSLVVPILGKNKQFLGVASIDLSIEQFANYFEKLILMVLKMPM
jgi:hypothetical protein